jgi:hypothetical protein
MSSGRRIARVATAPDLGVDLRQPIAGVFNNSKKVLIVES